MNFLDGPGSFGRFRARPLERSRQGMYHAKAYSVPSATSPFARTTIQRRDPAAHDVRIEILFRACEVEAPGIETYR